MDKKPDIARIISGVRLLHLADASGIPIATLWRWREKNAIPGHPPVKELHLQRLREGVRKVKAIDMAILRKQRTRNQALLAMGVGERHWALRARQKQQAR